MLNLNTLVVGLFVLSLTACQMTDSNTELSATETNVDKPITDANMNSDICRLIEDEYYSNSSIDCAKVASRTTKEYHSGQTLSMQDIESKNDRYTCSLSSKKVFANQHVDQNGDIVTTAEGWKTTLTECTPNSLKDHLNALADGANIANGDAAVLNYDIATFSYNAEVKDLEQALVNETDSDSCQFETIRSTKGSIDELDMRDFGDDIASALEKLKEKGQIKHAISRVWDGVSGDSEYCSYFYYKVFTTDGQVLILDYDHTT